MDIVEIQTNAHEIRNSFSLLTKADQKTITQENTKYSNFNTKRRKTETKQNKKHIKNNAAYVYMQP